MYTNGIKCWRRIFFTQRDEYDCDTLDEFVRKHRDEIQESRTEEE